LAYLGAARGTRSQFLPPDLDHREDFRGLRGTTLALDRGCNLAAADHNGPLGRQRCHNRVARPI